GIRDFHVTGVQTCALPISRNDRKPVNHPGKPDADRKQEAPVQKDRRLQPGAPRKDSGPAWKSREPVRKPTEKIPPRRPVDRKETEARKGPERSEEHTSELQSRENLVCRLLLE